MSSEILWRIPNVDNIRTPFKILKEQAFLLRELTSGALIGHASTMGSRDKMVSHLRLVVPSLNDYTVLLVQYVQPIVSLYPGKLTLAPTDTSEEVGTEKEFMEALGRMLGSQEVTGLIASLLSQAKAIKPT